MKGKYKEISFSYVYDQLTFILDIQRTPDKKCKGKEKIETKE